jgi:hypothetical protein
LKPTPSRSTHGQAILQEGRHETHRYDGALGRFISELGEKGLPFFKLLKKADKFVWDEEAQKAFEALKDSLTTPPIMMPPIPGETLLYISATTNVVSTVLVTE